MVECSIVVQSSRTVDKRNEYLQDVREFEKISLRLLYDRRESISTYDEYYTRTVNVNVFFFFAHK